MNAIIEIDPAVVDLSVAFVEAMDVQIEPASNDLRTYCDQVAAEVLREGLAGGDVQRNAVRQLLRHGGFKPSGRSKPAQEYLLRTVDQERQLPLICNVVDLINAISLHSGWPISLVSLDRIGVNLTIRYGLTGEHYVFNRANQELDLAGLLCICSDADGATIPRGSPVKDSMAGKVTDTDRHLLACIFAPFSGTDTARLSRWAEQLEQGFVTWCGASKTRSWIESTS